VCLVGVKFGMAESLPVLEVFVISLLILVRLASWSLALSTISASLSYLCFWLFLLCSGCKRLWFSSSSGVSCGYLFWVESPRFIWMHAMSRLKIPTNERLRLAHKSMLRVGSNIIIPINSRKNPFPLCVTKNSMNYKILTFYLSAAKRRPPKIIK
jgi:hypothetical protein